jgi:hypothetical protein
VLLLDKSPASKSRVLECIPMWQRCHFSSKVGLRHKQDDESSRRKWLATFKPCTYYRWLLHIKVFTFLHISSLLGKHQMFI